MHTFSQAGCEPEERTCHRDQFHCRSGTAVDSDDVCIPQTYRCDRHVDCSDASDEHDCPMDHCPLGSGDYMCKNGTVTPRGSDVGRGYCVAGHTRCVRKVPNIMDYMYSMIVSGSYFLPIRWVNRYKFVPIS